MNTYCPNCNNPIADASDQYCSACFEVRPPSGWPAQGGAGADAQPPASFAGGADDTPAARRRERPKTVIESDMDLQAVVAQAQQQAADPPPYSAPPSNTAPPPSSYGAPPPFGGGGGGAPPPQNPYKTPPSTGGFGGSPGSYGGQPTGGGYGGAPPGYGAPSGGGYAPQGSPHVQPPKKSNTGLILGIVGALVVVLGVCPCAGFFVFASRSDSDTPPVVSGRSTDPDFDKDDEFEDDKDDKDEPTRRRRVRRARRRKPPVVADSPSSVSSLNEQVITSRLQRAGWEVLGTPSRQNGPGYTTLIISIIRTPAGGAVGFYHYDNVTTAQTLENNFRENPNAAVKREGSDVVSVIMPDRPELARETLDVVLGKRSQ